MKNKMKKINQSVEISYSNSSQYGNIVNQWMPGGNVNIIFRKWCNTVNNEYEAKDKKGRWVSTMMEANGKSY